MIEMLDLIRKTYDRLEQRIPRGRQCLGRSLTLIENILIGHLPSIDGDEPVPERRKSTVGLRPDRYDKRQHPLPVEDTV